MERLGGRGVYCSMYAAAFVEHAPLSAQTDGLCSKGEDRAHSVVCTLLCLAYSRDSLCSTMHTDARACFVSVTVSWHREFRCVFVCIVHCPYAGHLHAVWV